MAKICLEAASAPLGHHIFLELLQAHFVHPEAIVVTAPGQSQLIEQYNNQLAVHSMDVRASQSTGQASDVTTLPRPVLWRPLNKLSTELAGWRESE